MVPSPHATPTTNPLHTRRSLTSRDMGNILATITIMTAIILTGLAIYMWRHPKTTFWAWKARRRSQRETAVPNSSSEHSLTSTNQYETYAPPPHYTPYPHPLLPNLPDLSCQIPRIWCPPNPHMQTKSSHTITIPRDPEYAPIPPPSSPSTLSPSLLPLKPRLTNHISLHPLIKNRSRPTRRSLGSEKYYEPLGAGPSHPGLGLVLNPSQYMNGGLRNDTKLLRVSRPRGSVTNVKIDKDIDDEEERALGAAPYYSGSRGSVAIDGM